MTSICRAVGLETGLGTNFLWSRSWSRLIRTGLEPRWSHSRRLKLVTRPAIKSALEFVAGDFFRSFKKQNKNKKTFFFFFSMPKQMLITPKFSLRETRFSTLIFRTVFTPGLTTQIVKLYCVTAKALKRKLQSHDVYWVELAKSRKQLRSNWAKTL